MISISISSISSKVANTTRLTSNTFRSSFRSFSSIISSSTSSSTSSSALSPINVTLFAYKICPFCCKTKSILKFAKVPFKAIEVNPLTKNELKVMEKSLVSKEDAGKKVEVYRKVPIALFHNTTPDSSPVRINGSTEIVSLLPSLSLLNGARLAYKSQSKNDSEFDDEHAMKWLSWCDDSLSVRIYPVLTQSFASSLRSFSYLDTIPSMSKMEVIVAKYVGSFFMVLGREKLKKKYNITDANESLKNEILKWETDGLSGKKFNGGEFAPNIADVGVYGVLKGLEITSGGSEGVNWHAEIVLGNKVVKDWYVRMGNVVGELE